MLPRPPVRERVFCTMWGAAPRHQSCYNKAGRPLGSSSMASRSATRSYYAARKNGYTVPALLRSWGRLSPLHTADRKGSALPPDPYREGRAAAPPRALPRTVRFRLECRPFYAPHSMTLPGQVQGLPRGARTPPLALKFRLTCPAAVGSVPLTPVSPWFLSPARPSARTPGRRGDRAGPQSVSSFLSGITRRGPWLTSSHGAPF